MDSIGRVIPNPSYLPPSVPYSCLVDLDASYHPAAPDSNGCETYTFPGEAGQSPAGTTLKFCYEQLAIAGASIPTPLGVGTPVPNGGAHRTICSVPVRGAPDAVSCETINETWWVLTSVTLPNGTQWKFGYDTYGQVNSVSTPTGAVITYGYGTRLACGNPPGEVPLSGVPTWPYSNLMSSRAITQRNLNLNDGSLLKTWTYTSNIGSGWTSSPNAGLVTVVDPLSNETDHNFSLIGQSVCGPYETSTVYYQQSGGSRSPLKEVDTSYTTTGPDDANPLNFSNYTSVGVLPHTTTTGIPTTTASGSIVSQQVMTYDQHGTYQDYNGLVHPFSFGQLMSESASDWEPGPLAPPLGWGAPRVLPAADFLRTTLHTFAWQSNWNYYAANMMELPCLETVFSGWYTGTQPSCAPPSAAWAAQTSFGYDESSYSHSGSRGNNTSVNRWLTGNATPISTHTFYTSSGFGMPWKKVDANGNPTVFTYDASGLYLKEIQYPPTPAVHNEFPTYDDNTGLLLSSTDQNSETTSYQYDSMHRIKYISFPDQGWEQYTYNDTPYLAAGSATPSFTYTKAINATLTYSATGRADALGRILSSLVTAPEGTIEKDTTYDPLGRVATTSNPYVTKSDPTYGVTSFTYDALGRKTAQAEPDGNGLHWCFDGVTPTGNPACTANHSSVTTGTVINSFDEDLNQTQAVSDGLGRLSAVLEPSPTTGSPLLETDYTYDILGNLKHVNQIGQTSLGELPRTRSFSYDSLSRLITSANPETGTICYGQVVSSVCQSGYDANGNLLYKTDARGSVLGYTYDALNRPLGKFYGATQTAWYSYDVVANATFNGTSPNLVGRLAFSRATAQSGGKYTDGYYGYDAMGRMKILSDAPPSEWGTSVHYVNAQYDLAGNLCSLTYPDGKIVRQIYDEAGRLSVAGAAASADCTQTTLTTAYANFSTYWPNGSPKTTLFGNGATQRATLNNREQTCEISDLLSPSAGGLTVIDHQYLFAASGSTVCTPTTGDNGNILQIVDNSNPTQGSNQKNQTFSYDRLNRLTSWNTPSMSGLARSQTYTFDSFGNIAQTMGTNMPNVTPGYDTYNHMLSTSFACGALSSTVGINTANPGYDLAGNVLCSGAASINAQAYLYDTESRVLQMQSQSMGNTYALSATYDYDPSGSRIRKDLPPFANANYTEYTYFNGAPVAEKTSALTWTDYIYANGMKIVKTDSQKPVLDLHGIRTSANYVCGTQGAVNGVPAGIARLVIANGDKLVVDMQQTLFTDGGIALIFTNGTGTGTVTDGATGVGLINDSFTDGVWHHFIGSLSGFVGLTTSYVLVGIHQDAAVGTFDLRFANAAVLHANGSISPIFTGQSASVAGFTGSNCGGSSLSSGTVLTATTDPNVNTNYFVDDHLGTTSMELNGGGWPIWQGQFAPFGAELADGTTDMHYKFTGKERDAESGNDYFGARIYASLMVRWMSPDWSAKAQPIPYAKLADPQSFNLYAYLANNPLSRFDPDGHACSSLSAPCSGSEHRNLENRAANSPYRLAVKEDYVDRQGRHVTYEVEKLDAQGNLHRLTKSDPQFHVTEHQSEAVAGTMGYSAYDWRSNDSVDINGKPKRRNFTHLIGLRICSLKGLGRVQ